MKPFRFVLRNVETKMRYDMQRNIMLYSRLQKKVISTLTNYPSLFRFASVSFPAPSPFRKSSVIALHSFSFFFSLINAGYLIITIFYLVIFAFRTVCTFFSDFVHICHLIFVAIMSYEISDGK